MGGSGGGGDGYRRLPSDLEQMVEQARSRERDRLTTSVNEYLDELLSTFNGRDVDLTAKRLDEIRDVLGDVVDMEQLLLGGSVAKHTDVDGISDIDALVVIDRADLADKTPPEVRAALYAELDAKLDRSEVTSVRAGEMAVTVVYHDGMEVQLLPAVRRGKSVQIGDSSVSTWCTINPRKFHSTLTSANKKLGGALVPAIKLLKSINSDLPEQKRLKSHHIEALAVDAAKKYSGSKVPREVLIHLCAHASKRVLKPVTDVTGQSRNVDDYLGKANSVQRRIAAQALAGIRRRLEAATSLEEWKRIFGGQ